MDGLGGGSARRGHQALAALAVAILALAAAACGGGSTGAGAGEAPIAPEQQQEGLTLVMDEFSFAPDTLTVSAGQEVVLTILNEGKKAHELMIGLPVGGGPGWQTDLFVRMDPQVVSGEGYELEGFEGMEEGHEEEEGDMQMHGAEIEVEAGGEVTLRLTVPADAAGEWEMGCFLPRHYESGMRGTLIVQ